MEQPAILNGTAPHVAPRQFPWSPAEESLLARIVTSERLSGRTKTDVWSKIAQRLAAESGFKLRTASSVRHRASKVGAYSRDGVAPAVPPTTPGPVVAVAAPEVERVVSQASFAAPEIRGIIADAFEDVARRLRGVA